MKKTLFKLLFFIPLFIALLIPIIWVDPLHLFARNHGMNSDYFYDQRLIKTNMVRYDHLDYNALLIGSSRIRGMGHITVGNYRFFNYGLGDLMLRDYPGFIQLAQACAPESLQCIIIGLDMYGSSDTTFYHTPWRSTQEYIELSKDLPFLMSLMISPNSFKYSMTQIYNAIMDKHKNRHRRFMVTISYYEPLYTGYEFDPQVIPILESLKKDLHTRVIFLTNPVSVKHFNIIKKTGRIPQFIQWLKFLANTTDGFYNFIDVTPLTTHKTYWRDGNHTDPEIYENEISKLLNNDINNPNYIYINRQNADSVIQEIQARFENYDLQQWTDDSN